MDQIEEICRQDLKAFLESEGHKFKGNMTWCPFHDDSNPSIHVSQKEDGTWVWYCHGCKKGGNIIHYYMEKYDCAKGEAIKKLDEKFRLERPQKESKIIDIYSYVDEEGKELYQMVRYEPKDFSARRKAGRRWTYDIKGVRRVLFRLPEVIKSGSVWLTEGEKDVKTFEKLGFCATTVPFGVGKWRAEYLEYFRNKEVFICLDEGYEDVAQKIAREIYRVAKEVRIIRLPSQEKNEDITDWIKKLGNIPLEQKKQKLFDVIIKSEAFNIDTGNLSINNDFLRQYCKSISKITDVPEIFIIFSGIGLLSGILNKFYFKYPRETHLNLYILLLAPSTLCRKTVCLDIANDYLNEVDENLYLPESFTPEALFKILDKQNRGLITWRELNQVKEFQIAKEYNKGLLAFLTDIYDFKNIWKRWTKGDGEMIIRKPVLSIMAGGITNWFTENLKQLDFEGGIWTRFLFIPGPEEEREYRLPKEFFLDKEIVNRLKKLNELPAKGMDLSRIAPLIEEWGKKHIDQAKNLDSGILQALFLRLEVMLIKLASILQLAHNHSQIIEPDTFKEAVKIIEYLKRRLVVFFDEEIHFSEFEKNKARILKYIKEKKRISYTLMLRNTKMGAEKLKGILYQLRAEGQVKWESGRVEYIGEI